MKIIFTNPSYLFYNFLVLCIVCFLTQSAYAQIGIGTNKPDSSAAMEISDTSKGILIPRMTMTQKNAIKKPADGLLIYQTDSSKGFYFYTGNTWKPFGQTNVGKAKITLTGSITNAEAAAKIAAEYGDITQSIQIFNCSKLTQVDLSMVKSLDEINISYNPLLKSVNLSNLESVVSQFSLNNCPQLTSFNVDALKTVNTQITISYVGLPNIVFPTLTSLDGGVLLQYNSRLKSISFPVLVDNDDNSNFNFQSNDSLTSLSFTSLEKVAFFSFTQSSGRTTNLLLPKLAFIRRLYLSGNGITTLDLPSLISVTDEFNVNSSTMLNAILLPQLQSVGVLTLSQISLSQSFTAPLLKSVGSFTLSAQNLLSISLPQLTTISNILSISNCNKLTTISMDALQNINSVVINGRPIVTISMNSLKQANTISLTNLASHNDLAFPSLSSVGFLNIISPIYTLSVPALTTAGYMQIQSVEIKTLSFPSLVSLTDSTNSTDISSCINLTSVLIDNFAVLENRSFSVSYDLLPSQQVNYLLHKFVTITPPVTGKTLSFSQKVSAPPTGQGITDKATLIAQSNTVSTN